MRGVCAEVSGAACGCGDGCREVPAGGGVWEPSALGLGGVEVGGRGGLFWEVVCCCCWW